MPRIQIDGTFVDLDESAVVSLIVGLAKSTFIAAKALHGQHLLGLPDLHQGGQRPLLTMRSPERDALENAISDPDIKSLLQSIASCATRLAQVDDEMVQWLADYFQVELSSENGPNTELEGEINKEISTSSEQRTGLLPWVEDLAYQRLVNLSRMSIAEMEEAYHKLQEVADNWQER